MKRVPKLLVLTWMVAVAGAACTGGGGGGGTVPVVITTESWNQFVVGQPYSLSLVAAGGSGAITWSVAEGSLPSGINLDPSTGAVSGTPTALATYTVVLRATDAIGQSDTRMLPVLTAISTTDPVGTGAGLSEGTRLAFGHGSGRATSAWSIRADAVLSRPPASWAELAGATGNVNPAGTFWVDASPMGGAASTGPVRVRETRRGTTVSPLDPRTTLNSAQAFFSPDGTRLALVLDPSDAPSEMRIYDTAGWSLVRTVPEVSGSVVFSPSSDRVAVRVSLEDRILGVSDPGLDRVLGSGGYSSCQPVLAWSATDRLARNCVGSSPSRLAFVTSRAADDGDSRELLSCEPAGSSCAGGGALVVTAAPSPTGARWALGLMQSLSFGGPGFLAVVADSPGAPPQALTSPTAAELDVPIRWR